jgi:hypothetical protein
MADPELSLDVAYDLLLKWSKSLADRVVSRKAEIFDFDGPFEAPSGPAFSLLAFNDIKSDLEEVVAALGHVEDAIFRLFD